MYSLANSLQIQIGSLPVIDFVHELRIESSWQKFTDTCSITLPRNVQAIRAGAVKNLADLISVGDAVSVAYGYDGNIRPEFAGYVSAVKPGTPFTVECEDAMWLLKRRQLSMAWRSVTLRELLQFVLDKNGLSAIPIQELGALVLGKYTVSQATGAQIFDSLKRQFGIFCFFRAGTLVAGDPYKLHGSPTVHKFGFRQNIISSDLTYTRKEDIAIHFQGISYLPGGKKIVVDEGGAVKQGKAPHKKGAPVAAASQVVNSFSHGAGELRTISAVGLNEAQLRAFVASEAKRLRFDGYRGSLTGFGLPATEHGDIAQIADPDYPEREGQYAIDKVLKTFGVNGSRRINYIGPKA
jgi:hypothetical protein